MSAMRKWIVGLLVIAAGLLFWFREQLLPAPDYSDYTPEALFRQGQMFEKGWGRDRDAAEAIRWYSLAADRDFVEAQFRLATLYYEGKLIEQDYDQALAWYLRAAENGHVDAQYQLGWMYHHGEGVPVDPDEAKKWFDRAREQGHEKARPVGF